MRLPHRAIAVTSAVLMGVGTIAITTPARAEEPAAPVAAAIDSTPPVNSELKIELHRAVAERQAEHVATARRVARAAKVTQTRARIIRIARKQLGDAYVAGRSGPNAFDCSGFTRFVYEQATGKDLPHYSRAQYRVVKKISKNQARPGDLVFFFRNGAEHVGIYLGRGRMIDAANPRSDVSINPITGSWWGRSYSGMGRLLPA